MLPLLAIGAAVTGTLLLGAASASGAGRTRQKSQKSEAQNQKAPTPEAYLVVPINGTEQPGKQTERLSALESVRKFIF
ncbi:MAG: hypothetical protein A2X94_12610 [Bdellovibrionales bacterium GWB1_55_8]|nr:MAG: hypothetical protein A2X94_12610 [Bdellovibrionales bacterium GWB1_55_8]